MCGLVGVESRREDEYVLFEIVLRPSMCAIVDSRKSIPSRRPHYQLCRLQTLLPNRP
jgi:hypothetical protein